MFVLIKIKFQKIKKKVKVNKKNQLRFLFTNFVSFICF